MSYRKGYKFEWEVRRFLERKGYYVIRSAGSKKPDIIAGKGREVLVIECKYTSKNKLYVPKSEVKNLLFVSEMFNAKPFFLVKRKNKGFFFVAPDEMEELEESFVIDLEKLEELRLS